MTQNVLLYCVDDFGNVGFEFQESLRRVGIIANGLKHVTHGIIYPEHMNKIVHDAELVGAVNSASHILYLQSTKPAMDATPMNRGSKKLFLFVGDQGYRRHPERILAYYKHLSKVFYQGSDLKGKSTYPEAWLLPAINTEVLKTKQDVSHMSHNSPIKIAHYPRNPKEKGSKVINKVMERLKTDSALSNKFSYSYSEQWEKIWIDNMARLDQCDIYIEQQAYTIKSGEEERPLNEFGVTALEAASLSKIVITCFGSFNDYKIDFGNRSEIIPSGSEETLEITLRRLLDFSADKLIEKRINTREWVHSFHGREATGRRLSKLLGIKK